MTASATVSLSSRTRDDVGDEDDERRHDHDNQFGKLNPSLVKLHALHSCQRTASAIRLIGGSANAAEPRYPVQSVVATQPIAHCSAP